MSRSLLWVVSVDGQAYTLSQSSRFLQLVPKNEKNRTPVKRVSACDQSTWAIGSDNQVYVYVHASEVPIRVQKNTFENERWSPFSDFSSSNLLSGDRRTWSDVNGKGDYPKESFHLPSCNWVWEEGWGLDENLDGEVTDIGGWQYAANFQSKFTPEKRWNSCVRKRKWTCFRQYKATDKWAEIQSLRRDKQLEPFIDVSVGGYEIPNQPQGHICVWAISILNQVYVRTGVTYDNPEGDLWRHVPIETTSISMLSVGPTGAVWGVTIDGQALVRTDVSREQVYGLAWILVPFVSDFDQIKQVSVGTNAVWAVSICNKVWFRKGIQYRDTGSEKEEKIGTAWVQMVGEMRMVSVGPRDQVFGIGAEDKMLYCRTGITPDDLMGRTWQLLNLSELSTWPLHSASESSLVLSESEKTETASTTMVNEDNKATERAHGNVCDEFSKISNLCTDLSTNSVDVRGICTKDMTLESEVQDAASGSPSTDTSRAIISNLRRHQDTATHSNNTQESTLTIAIGNPGLNTDNICDNTAYDISDNTTGDISDNTGDISDNTGDISDMQFDIKIRNSVEDIVDKTVGDIEMQHIVTRSPTAILVLDNKVNGESELPVIEGKNIESFSTSDVVKESEREMDYQEMSIDEPTALCDSMPNVHETVDIEQQFSIESNNSVAFNFVTDLLTEEIDEILVEKVSSDLHPEDVLADDIESPEISCNQTDDQIEAHSDVTFATDFTEIFQCGPVNTVFSWISAQCLVVDNLHAVPWLLSKKDSTTDAGRFYAACISMTLRKTLLNKLQERNFKQLHKFSHLEEATERKSWVKRSSFQCFFSDRSPRWYDCTVELEHSLDGSGGIITIQYEEKKKQMSIQLFPSDILCICPINDPDYRPVFAVFIVSKGSVTSVVQLRANSDDEMYDWLRAIYQSNMDHLCVSSEIPGGSIWSTTVRGNILVHIPQFHRAIMKPCEIYWQHLGGHLTQIESSQSGVTWGLGQDHTPWVYNGGYGGGFLKGLSEGAGNVCTQSDVKCICLCENQKWTPMFGYSDRGFTMDAYSWSDKTGRHERTKEGTKQPSSQWQWVGTVVAINVSPSRKITDWSIDFTTPGGVDKEGWQYASNFHRTFHSDRKWRDYVRRRFWERKCKLISFGPWMEVSPIQIRDVSIQVDQPPSRSSHIALWAIGINNSVLCRMNVTIENPKGDHWQHVATDQSFQSVSVGGQYRVWAVARDGSVWFRNGVSVSKPTGLCWFHVVPPPPSGFILIQISAGHTAVWAVDVKEYLWFRRDITSTFPEGTCWVQICGKIKQVSVGPNDQVWIISAAGFNRKQAGSGYIYVRTGIAPECPTGIGWDLVIGGGWSHVSVRGCHQEIFP